MSKAENIATQERFGKAVNTDSLTDLNQLVAPDCVEHDPAPGQSRGPQGYIAIFREMIDAFPDFAVDVEHLTADDETVAIAYTMTGTHRGSFMGIPATGRRISARGVQIARFNSDAIMVERWGSSDQLGILEQLGADVRA